MNAPLSTPKPDVSAAHRPWTYVEIGLILLVFFLFAGSPPPAVNEAHYLAKAKHYWNPGWCPHDQFLQSKDAHLVFNWAFGWLTLLLPLSAVAWVGRIITWGLLAWGWQRLSTAVAPRKLLSVLSAGLFLCLIERCHLAGEWVVGGVEAKGFAFVCLFFALPSLVKGRWGRAWLLLGGAASLHVLVGGWSMVAAGLVWLTAGPRRPPVRAMVPFWAGALVLALPGLAAGLALTWGVHGELLREANRIYVLERLPHHLAPHTFAPLSVKLPEFWPGGPGYFLLLPGAPILRHGALLLVWLALWPAVRSDPSQRLLQSFVGGAVIIAAIGALMDVVSVFHPAIGAALLRYYWFRLSDAMVPLGVSLAVVGLLIRLESSRRVLARCGYGAAVLVASINLAVAVADRLQDFRPGADRQALSISVGDPRGTRRIYNDWLRLCRWVVDNTEADCLVLTPPFQQTFKWYAGRGEVVSWKDVPQDARALVRWWHGYQELYPPAVKRWGLGAHGRRRLLELARKYGASYIVVDRTRSPQPLGLARLYPNRREKNRSYAVYWVPRGP